MRPFGRLRSVASVRRQLLRAIHPIERVENVPVETAFDRILARDVVAPRPVPEFARTTWDGYAIRSADTGTARPAAPAELTVVGEVFAEGAFPRTLRAGEAVEIATGGAIPRGADTVVIFEEVERTGRRLRVSRPVPRGDRISPPGQDFPRGARLARRGERLSAVAVGSIAACGLPKVPVYARPIVAIVPNGNELLVPGTRGGPGRIYESNNATLSAVVTAAGGVPRPEPPVRDDSRAIERSLRRALRTSDLVLATGGSSVGERDHLPQILPRLGTLLFHGIAVRPGKPTLAAAVRGKVVVGMPGHPTSCLANMYWLVLPALHRLGRRPGPGYSEGTAVLGADAVAPSSGMSTVVPLRFRGGRAYPTFRGSAIHASLSGATAFAMLAPGTRRARAGDRLRVYRLDPPLGPPSVGGNG